MGVKAWITVNGNHIPIMDGETSKDAVRRFTEKKRQERENKFSFKTVTRNGRDVDVKSIRNGYLVTIKSKDGKDNDFVGDYKTLDDMKKDLSWLGITKNTFERDFNSHKFTNTLNKIDRVNKANNKRAKNEDKLVAQYKKLAAKEYNAKTIAGKNRIVAEMNKIYKEAEKAGPKSARRLTRERTKIRKELKNK